MRPVPVGARAWAPKESSGTSLDQLWGPETQSETIWACAGV